ncbi:MAG: InlB B-repeat-containing protein [Eubacteriales bacterium]|nr:InlB B-repeat-containing protein [Eubacteriales bacterium]
MKGIVWRIVGVVLSAIVIGAFVFCAIWTVRNWRTVHASLDGTNIYTAADVKKAEEEAWAKAALSEAEKDKTIDDLREVISGLQVTYSNEKDKMQKTLDEYIYIFNSLKNSVENTQLNEQSILVFIADDKVVDVRAVENNSIFTGEIQTPTKEGYHFIGWSLNGVDVIDLSTYEFAQNTTLTAVFEINTYTIKFIARYGDNEVNCGETQIAHGGLVSPSEISLFNQSAVNFGKTIPVKNNETVEFNGWTTNGYVRTVYADDGTACWDPTIDFSEYQIKSDTEIVAYYLINCGNINDIGDKPVILDNLNR